MSTDRLDAQVEVKVPAQNGRKAYSYFRNVSAAKKGAAGVGGALALGGLAAAAIALRKTPEESKAIPAPVPAPIQPTSSVESVARKVAIGAGKITGVAALNAAGALAATQASGFLIKGMTKDRRSPEQKDADQKQKQEKEGQDREARYTSFLESDPRLKAKDNIEYQKTMAQIAVQKVRGEELATLIEEDVSKYLEKVKKSEKDLLSKTVGIDRLPSPKPKLEVGGALVSVNKSQPATPPIPSKLPYNPPAPKVSTGALTIAPNESGKASGSAIAEPNKTLLTKVAGSAGAAAGKLYRKTKEGLERDRVAREKLANRTVDINDTARKAGAATRSTINAVDNFARSFMQTFVDRNNTVDVSASEVKTTQREMPKRTRRANKTMNRIWNKSSRRYESFDQRIDSFIATRLLGES